MAEVTAVTPSYGGISHERLGQAGLQWPCPTTEHPGTPILHVDQSGPRIRPYFISASASLAF